MTDGTGLTSYLYDEANRLTSVTSPGPKTVGYRYDLDGNRTKLIYPDATAVTYSFNKASQLASLADWASRQVNYTYDADGLVKTVTKPDSSIASYTYDNALRTTGIVDQRTNTLITQLAYTLDPLGNVTNIQEWVQGVSQGSPAWADRTAVNDVTSGSQATAAVALGADGAAYAVWNDQGVSPMTIRYARRDPTTGAWGASELAGEVPGFDRKEPAIAVDASNNVYVVWTDYRVGAGDPDIYFSKRSASTGTWSQSVKVNDDAAGAVQNAPSIALSSTGAAVAVWYDTRGGGGKQNIYSARLAAGGSVWAANIKITSNATANKQGPRVAIGADGTAYSVWGDARNSGQYDIYFASLGPLASVWSTNTKVSDDPGSAAQLDPDLGLDTAGNITAVWRDQRVSPATVRAARRPSGSSNWSASVNLGGSDANYPRVAVRADGRAYAVWQGPSISGSEYNAGTGTWSALEQVALPGEAAERPAVAISSAQLIAVWDSAPAGSTDVYARVKTLAGYGGPDTFAAGYDRLSRLTSVSGPDGNRTYVYDPVGNRSSKVLGGTTAYTYDRADRITAAGATSITVNANGNLTAKGTDSYAYNQANRLTSATVVGASETYAYDGDGVRFSRQLGASQPIRYVSDVNRSLPVTIDDGTRKYVYGLGLAYAVNGSALEVYHTDRLGSTRVLTDASGAATAGYRTDEYGVPTVTTGSSAQPFRFTGEPRDATGLSYVRARYHDPNLGRFMSRDVWAGDPSACQTLNRYAYVLNNPLTRVDPSGLKSRALDVAAKCAYAGLQVGLESASIWSAGSYGVALASGGALVPGVNVVLVGLLAWNTFVAVNNWQHTAESVGYCLGRQDTFPTAPSIDVPNLPIPPIFPGPNGLPIPALE